MNPLHSRLLVGSSFAAVTALSHVGWCASDAAESKAPSEQAALPHPATAPQSSAGATATTNANQAPSTSKPAEAPNSGSANACSKPTSEPPAAPALVDLALMPLYSLQNFRAGACPNCLDSNHPLSLQSYVAPGFRVSLGYRAPRRQRGDATYTNDIVLAAYVDYVFAADQTDFLSRVSLGSLLQVGVTSVFAVEPRVFGTVINVQTPNGKESFGGIGAGLDLAMTFGRADWHLEQVVLGVDAAYPFAEHDPSGSSSVSARAFSAMAGLRVALGTDLATTH